jgi:uncharacterized membrane protein HdeD (DUF308 family)
VSNRFKLDESLAGQPDERTGPEGYFPYWLRVAEIIFGILSVAIAVVVIANPTFGDQNLVLLLSFALIFSAFRMIAAGGVRRQLMSIEGLGLAGGGLLALFLVVAVVMVPGLSIQTLVFLLAVSLTIQGLGRILHSWGRGAPRWLRGSALATGLVMVMLAGVVELVQGVALFTLVALLAVTVLVNGVESIVSGLRPSNPRQLTLLKLILFSAFYGLVLVNWIDLYGSSAPGYHVWVILIMMSPFGVVLVFQGLKDWQLAISLGLLVSLMNDLGYYFIGDLLFNFHVALVPWLGNQLGLRGTETLFTFQGGLFSFPVSSFLMGASIYGRLAVVSVVLYHWWTRPSRL